MTLIVPSPEAYTAPPPIALATALELLMTTVGAEVNAEQRARMSVKLATLNFQVFAVVAELQPWSSSTAFR
jgi:hypothetical protein